jgi:hypothetical protein
MKIKNKKKFFSLLAVLLFFFLQAKTIYAFGAYPKVPGLPTITENSSLPQFVSYIFGLLIYLAGAISLISFTIGAVSLIFSVDSAERASNAKDRMKGAVLGLVLTLTSGLLLGQINKTQLTTVTLGTLKQGTGLFYTGGNGGPVPAPSAESNLASRPANLNGYNTLFYTCPSGVTTKLIVKKFPEKDFGGYDKSAVQIIDCNQSAPVGEYLSYQTTPVTDGVYFYLEKGCQGYVSDPITSDQALPAPFSGKALSVGFVGDYGAVLHNEINPNKGGLCSGIIVKNCTNITIPISSASIFKINYTPLTSGTGINFYSEPFNKGGCETIAWSASNFQCKPTTVGAKYPVFTITPEQMVFGYDGSGMEQTYINTYSNFKERQGSIEFGSGYRVVLYSSNSDDEVSTCPCLDNPNKQCLNPSKLPCEGGQTSNSAGSYYCQVFSKDVPNLNIEDFLAHGMGKLSNVIIVATQ